MNGSRDDRLNLLWVSQSPLGRSGYSNQSKLFTPRIHAAGHGVAILATSFEGQAFEWEGIQIFPRWADKNGSDVILATLGATFGPEGIVFGLSDPWTVSARVVAETKAAWWAPVDHEPLMPHTDVWFRQTGAVPVAMSRHGEQSFREAGFDPLYVPHGVDTKEFTPLVREEARKALGWPQQAFIAGMVADNFGERKNFPGAFEAFARFRESHPDAMLFVHSDVVGAKPDSTDLTVLASQLRIPPDSLLGFSMIDQQRYRAHVTTRELAAMYSAMDVLLHPAMGGGFEIPLVEAAACGTPAITNGFGAIGETGKIGWKAESVPHYDRPFMSWYRLALVDSLVDCLERAYSEGDWIAIRQAARAHAESYDVELVLTEFMLPALDEIGNRLGTNQPHLEAVAP